MTPLMRARHLRKSYGGVTAVDDVSIALERGEILGVIGPNGAGKTTLVDLLSGTQIADRGTLEIDGRIVGARSHRRAQAGFARTFQHPLLAPSLTVRENILVGRASLELSGIGQMITGIVKGVRRPKESRDDALVRQLADEVRLHGLERRGQRLTLGEQRLVEVARAFSQDPNVLLLDEPFAGSDVEGVDGITDVIRVAQKRGCGVLIVDHNVDLVASLVDRVVLMAEGAAIFDGSPGDALQSKEMNRVYFGGEEHRER